MTLERPGGESEDALQIDIYLESLLVARERRPRMSPSVDPADQLDADQRRAAGLLSAHLVRFHPSYRFEEALAGRLRGAALRIVAGSADAHGVPARSAERPDARASSETTDPPAIDGVVLPFPLLPTVPALGQARVAARPGSLDLVAGDSAAARRRVLIGSAIASGVSLAGAALVAWRVSSPPRSAFGRATRAAHRSRPALRGRA